MTKIDIVTELTDTSILQNQDQIIWSITNIGISSEFDQYGHVFWIWSIWAYIQNAWITNMGSLLE